MSLASVSCVTTENTAAATDPRYALTDKERVALIALKQACDEENIYYKNPFELAKYVLVVESSYKDTDPKAEQKRLKKAISLLKKRNDTAAKLGLDRVDSQKALEELYRVAPDYFVMGYSHDSEGHPAVGHCPSHAPSDYIYQSKENAAKFLVQEQWRYDLGAVDLEEARKGFCLVGTGKISAKGAFNYLKMVAKGQENLKPMHPNRIKKIHTQVPPILAYVVPLGKALVPRKIADRLVTYGSLKKLEESMKASQVPHQTVLQWAKERHALYLETVEKMTI